MYYNKDSSFIMYVAAFHKEYNNIYRVCTLYSPYRIVDSYHKMNRYIMCRYDQFSQAWLHKSDRLADH